MADGTGILLIISGPSGAGKSTVLNAVMQYRDDMFFSVSATTRSPRQGEKDGEHYHFMSRETFFSLRDSGKLLEWAEYAGDFYGTPSEPVIKRMELGQIIVLDLETEGALAVMKKCPDAVSIFLTPSTLCEVERRLRERRTETEEKIRLRMSLAKESLSCIGYYTYVVVNDTLRAAVHQMESILLSEQCKTKRLPEFFAEYRKDDIYA